MKLLLTTLTVLFLSISNSFSQGTIPPPSWSTSDKDLKSYDQKIIKQIAQYGFTSLDGFTFEKKHPERENQGAFSKYSRSSFGCYKTVTKTYSDVWPADWYVFPYLAKSPKNADGVEYEFNVYVRYSRSSFTSNCIGTLKNSYSFHAITVDLNKVMGNELSNEEMNQILFNRLDYQRNYEYYGTSGNVKGITRIDSIKWEQDTEFFHSEKDLTEYFVTLYGEIANYDDFLTTEANKIVLSGKVRFRIRPNKKTECWYTRKEDQIVESLDVATYPICQNGEEVGMSEVYQKYTLSEVPTCSKKTMSEALSQIISKSKSLSKEAFQQDEVMSSLFAQSEDIEAVAVYFNEINNAMWTIEKEELKSWSAINNEHASGHMTLIQYMERNLTKDQISELKGKVSKESLKAAKLHQKGRIQVQFFFKDVDGELKVEKVEFKNQLETVR